MPASCFDDFCQRLCAHLGVDTPAADPDELTPGITVLINDIEFGFMPDGDGRDGLMVVMFGAPPAGRETEACQSLLDVNFLMMSTRSAVFGRNPHDGAVTMHCAISMPDAPLQAIQDSMTQIAQVVTRWRAGEFTQASDTSAALAAFASGLQA